MSVRTCKQVMVVCIKKHVEQVELLLLNFAVRKLITRLGTTVGVHKFRAPGRPGD